MEPTPSAPAPGSKLPRRPPRVCFVGPMLGRNEGWVTTQGEVLADLFVSEGWDVHETSTHPTRVLRLLDTVSCLTRWRREVDVVVLSVFSGPAFVMADISVRAARLLGIPVVLWLHGGDLPKFALRHRSWVGRVLRQGIATVAPTPYLAAVANSAGVSASVIPNVVDLGAVPFHEREKASPRLLWMRTFHEIYNPVLAVRVLELVRRRHPDAVLTMAGQEKGSTAEVRREVERLGLSDAVQFAGFLGPEAKREAFAAHDIFLNTNRVDNAPVSVLEAAAAGLVVVATEVGGIPHLLDHGHTALLVPDDDAEAMAKAVNRLLDDPPLVASLSRNGHALAQRSAWPAVRTMWLQELETAVSGA